MIVTKKHIGRRTFLKGAGAAIGLPFLDAMVPAFALPAAQDPKATRMAFIYVANGFGRMNEWTPAASGRLTELPKVLQKLEAHRDDFSIFTNLAQREGLSLPRNRQGGGRQGGAPANQNAPGGQNGPAAAVPTAETGVIEAHADHARGLTAYLTGVRCKPTQGKDIYNGVSMDQIAAQMIGHQTRLASLELGIEDGRQIGTCDAGYSCAYNNNLSWRTPTVPNPPEVNPRRVFERMFGAAGEDPATRAERLRREKSILDLVTGQTRRLRGDLGVTDQRKLDEYLEAVRDIERRVEKAETESTELPVSLVRPDGIPADYIEHCNLMYDLIAVAFQANLTRIVTFMMSREQTNRAYRELGITEGHHELTHHRGDEEKIEKVSQINLYQAGIFNSFLTKMKSISDGDGTLLDHSMVVYGSAIGDGNSHDHLHIPTLIAGKGLGFRTGRHYTYAEGTPMTNLFLTMLDRMDCRVDKLGDSTGKLEPLAEA